MPGPARELVDQDVFRDAIGRFASGVTVITTRVGDQDYGTTASALTSLSLEPPMLLVCLNRTSATRAAIAESGWFAVNILGRQQSELAHAFARKAPDKFRGAEVERSARGLPLLAGALAHLECRVGETATGGTHTVFMGLVEDAVAHPGEPLTYYRGQFGRTFVASALDERTAHEAVDARWALEVAVVEKVAGAVGDEDARILRAHAAAAQAAALAEPPDLEALLARADAFHTHFIGLLGNATLLTFYDGLDIGGIWVKASSEVVLQGRAAAAHLVALAETLVAGDRVAATRILSEHAARVKEHATLVIASLGGAV